MDSHRTDLSLKKIEAKIKNGARLDFEDGVRLFQSRDILALGALANGVREKVSGKKTFYSRNLHLNYTNICMSRCSFCHFSKNGNSDGAYALSVPQICARVRAALDRFQINEVHIVGGLNPESGLDYLTEIVRSIRNLSKDIFIKAFTACEIEFVSRLSGKPVDQCLSALKQAGLNSLPGGGAEILNDSVREKLGVHKAGAEEWLRVHRVAHNLGLVSNGTMLYGHVETIEERVEHLLKLRALQDETGGFRAFVPLLYTVRGQAYSGSGPLGALGPDPNQGLPPQSVGRIRPLAETPDGYDDLKMFSVARLILDNIPHIKVHVPAFGVKLAQVALAFGADDFGGLNLHEEIFAFSSGVPSRALTEKSLLFYIESGGYEPALTDSSYQSHPRVRQGAPV